MKAFEKKTELELYKEFVTHWPSFEVMAINYGVSVPELKIKVARGAEQHAKEIHEKRKQKQPIKPKCEVYAICVNNQRNPDLGKVQDWVTAGRMYRAKDIEVSETYKGELIFDLFDNKGKHLIPNETYQKWRSNRFVMFLHILN